jgi:hypothetical protein
MTIVAIIVALLLAFLAFRFIKGVIKFGLIAIIVIAVIWFLVSNGVGS